MSEVITTQEFPQYLKPEHIEIILNAPTKEEVKEEGETEEFNILQRVCFFDFYYDYSDDGNVYRNAVKKKAEIEELVTNSSIEQSKKDLYLKALNNKDARKTVLNLYDATKFVKRRKLTASKIHEIKSYVLGIDDHDWSQRKLVAALVKQLFLALPNVWSGHYVYNEKGPGMLFIRKNFTRYPGMAISDKAQDLVDQIANLITELKYIDSLGRIDESDFVINLSFFKLEENLTEYSINVKFGEEYKNIKFLFK
ncbi:MAG: hypothetical protein WC981_02805 [Candidatus Dojkabacteria bacterium]